MGPLVIGPPRMKMGPTATVLPRLQRRLPRFSVSRGLAIILPRRTPHPPPRLRAGVRITEVMDREEGASLTNPLEGWPHEDQYWPTTVGRCVHSDPTFAKGVGRAPAQVARSGPDILTRALTCVGAERVPAEEFWALAEQGRLDAVLKGRDFEVWAPPQRPACAYRHEYP